jgi:predicted nuclease with TOPRIM domain
MSILKPEERCNLIEQDQERLCKSLSTLVGENKRLRERVDELEATAFALKNHLKLECVTEEVDNCGVKTTYMRPRAV